MGTKNKPGKFDCYDAAEPDEPIFVLLGRDKHAPTLVWLWSVMRELDGEVPDKVNEARECCGNMLSWAADHGRPAVGLGQAALAGVMELIRTANYKTENAKNIETHDDLLRLYLSKTEFGPEFSSGK